VLRRGRGGALSEAYERLPLHSTRPAGSSSAADRGVGDDAARAAEAEAERLRRAELRAYRIGLRRRYGRRAPRDDAAFAGGSSRAVATR